MDDYGDEVRLKNTLSHKGACEMTSKKERQGARLRSCSDVVHLARVHVIVLVDVVCLMLVLNARVIVHAVVVQFP